MPYPLRMRRLRPSFFLSFAAGILTAAPVLPAQGARPAKAGAHPPITWCDNPAENPEWARRIAYLTIGSWEPDSSEGLRVLRSAFPYILSGIAEHFIAEHQPGRNLAARTLEEIPAGEPHYGPVDLFSGVRFDLRGDGSIESVSRYGRRGAAIRDDLMSALLGAIASGKVFGPYADSSVRTALFVGIRPDSVLGTARWPAFSIDVPLSRPARADPRNRLRYPPQAMGWRGSLQYEFVIDEDGRVVPGSIRNLVPPEKVEWDTQQRRQIYESFIKTVEAGLARFKYEPAEDFGCRQRSTVVQAFQFEMGN